MYLLPFTFLKTYKAYKSQKWFSKKNPACFGHKTTEPTGFHDNVVIVKYKQMFHQKNGS